MRVGKKTASALALGLLVGAAVVLFFVFRPKEAPDLSKVRDRIRKLKRSVEKESVDGKVVYNPKVKGQIDGLDVPVENILRQLPAVVQVEVLVWADKPTNRIVHIRDWHYVPKNLYAIDMRDAVKRPVSDEEIDLLHEELLLEVELVQLEQMALLRCLIKHHGLHRMFSEGLTKKGLPLFKDNIEAYRAVGIPALYKQLDEIRQVMKGMEGRENTDGYQKAKGIEDEITALLNQHRLELLELGSPGRLLIAGEIEAVLPLEDEERLAKAKPITPTGQVKLDPDKLEARHDAQVQAALDHGSFALVILGGSHDLSNSVKKLGKGTCEYIRVTTKRYQEIAGEK